MFSLVAEPCHCSTGFVVNACYGNRSPGCNGSLVALRMPNYRRPYIAGGTYFITQVTYQRVPWLCWDIGRQALREAFIAVKERHQTIWG